MFAITRTQSYKTDYANIKIFDLLELGKRHFLGVNYGVISTQKFVHRNLPKISPKNGFMKPKLDWLLDLLQQKCKHGSVTE